MSVSISYRFVAIQLFLEFDMTITSDNETKTFVKTVTTWHSARVVFSAFIAAHPELGLKDSKITFRNFCSRHGQVLRKHDVMRKPAGLRSPAIFDGSRFDEVAFDLMSKRFVGEQHE